MSYEAVEDQLYTTLQLIDGIGEFELSKGDFGILNAGPRRAIILMYNSFQQAPRVSGGPTLRIWEISIILVVNYFDDVQVHDDLRDLRDSVMNIVQQYPNLGDSSIVFDAEIVSGSILPPILDEGMNYMEEELICHVQELSNLNFA